MPGLRQLVIAAVTFAVCLSLGTSTAYVPNTGITEASPGKCPLHFAHPTGPNQTMTVEDLGVATDSGTTAF
jgi:hypothetical protein